MENDLAEDIIERLRMRTPLHPFALLRYSRRNPSIWLE